MKFFNLGLYQLDIFNIPSWVSFGHFYAYLLQNCIQGHISLDHILIGLGYIHKYCYWHINHISMSYNIFSCDQVALWMVLSVRPSIFHTIFTMSLSSYHHKIFRSHYHWQKWCPCKRSRSEVKRLFWTITPVWIHRWLRNDAHSLK